MTYFIGDVHGQREKVERLLHDHHLVDSNLQWTGGDATLWLMGDFVDRGSDGIGVIDIIMKLQAEAKEYGGAVHALLGNHDILLLATHRFGEQPTTGPGGTFISDWLQCGGNPEDLARLRPHHIQWLTQLPALALMGDTLVVHADATFYTRYGTTIEAVNHAFRAILVSDDSAAWDQILEDFSERLHFMGEENAPVLMQFLTTFGATNLIHGHTPIPYVTKMEPVSVTTPLVYAEGKCVNVDGGMYMGGAGFVYQD